MGGCSCDNYLGEKPPSPSPGGVLAELSPGVLWLRSAWSQVSLARHFSHLLAGGAAVLNSLAMLAQHTEPGHPSSLAAASEGPLSTKGGPCAVCPWEKIPANTVSCDSKTFRTALTLAQM